VISSLFLVLTNLKDSAFPFDTPVASILFCFVYRSRATDPPLRIKHRNALDHACSDGTDSPSYSYYSGTDSAGDYGHGQQEHIGE